MVDAVGVVVVGGGGSESLERIHLGRAGPGEM